MKGLRYLMLLEELLDFIVLFSTFDHPLQPLLRGITFEGFLSNVTQELLLMLHIYHSVMTLQTDKH